MSFSCPHFCPDEDHCLRLKTDCVPGRKGCVLEGKAEFAVPAEERVRLLEEAKRQAAAEALARGEMPPPIRSRRGS
jgi:hypothetical protein